MTVALESHGAARVLRVNRPDAHNALDSKTMDAFVAHARAIDGDARAIVIAAAGPSFIAGGDLKEFGALRGRAGGRAVSSKGHAVVRALRAIGLPLVAAIDGDAYGGGCELAAACDLRFARSTARFHWVQNKLAVTTGWGATHRLAQLVGVSTAARWLLAAESVSAEDAHRAGFVDQLAHEVSALDLALAWCERVASIDPTVTRLQLGLLRAEHEERSKRAHERERRAFAECWALEAHERAVQRFIERSKR
jgi:enoyl-CoA hydratase/carnithine racemase